jgi:ubiquinone/menaquinone biosynthesis C-methylase UbiE/YHS domain-containing protein
MQLKNKVGKITMIVFTLAVFIGTCKSGQAAKSDIAEPSKTATKMVDSSAVPKLSPQTTCPVMGNPIDTTQYVDYKGKRIYVCCAMCIASVKKDPEKYIKKLEEMGQGVKSIGDTAKGTNNTLVVDTTSKAVPINCPLMKQGVNVHNMKPFEDSKKYIEFLERKDRAVWQKPDEVVSSLNLKGSETIADLGAGSGYFTFRFSKALPKGKVIAIDPDPEMVRYIHHKTMSSDIKNIEVILGSYDDPKIPEKVDMVFICDVLHHVGKRAEWLAKLSSEMDKGAKLVLIEFKEGNLPEGPPEKIKISGKEMLSLVFNAGFKLIKENSTLLPYQNYFVFEKQ